MKTYSKAFGKNLYLLLIVALYASACSKKLATTNTQDQKFKAKSEFDVVLSYVTNKELKQQLEIFRKGGIERKLSLNTKNPDTIIKEARRFLGTKHKMGGTNKKGMDCSGLLKVSFAKAGASLPHSSHEQGRYGKVIAHTKDLQKGDLVFFINTYRSKNLITHSGIYLGDGKFIHASSKKGVSIANVNDPYYWKDKYIFGTRVF